MTVNGEAAPVSFVSNTQINFLLPADIVPGPVRIETTNNGRSSAFVSTTALLTAPSFLLFGTNATNGHLYLRRPTLTTLRSDLPAYSAV